MPSTLKTRPLSVRIDESTIKRLDELARKECRNRASLIHYFIASGLEKAERDAANAQTPEQR